MIGRRLVVMPAGWSASREFWIPSRRPTMAANGEPVKKRTLSEAELAARRANAKKSTGPKDTSRTRYNGTKHGLRGGPVLPGESQEAYDRRMEGWMKDHAPANDSQAFMVTCLVDLSFKIARGDAVETALGLE